MEENEQKSQTEQSGQNSAEAGRDGKSGKSGKSGRKIALGAGILAAVLVVMLCVYHAFGPKAQTGTKAYTVEVVDNTGATKSYEGRTNAEYLSGLMDELVQEGDFSYDGSSSDYGLFITTINGVTADYDKDGSYWSIYVNGEMGQYGADSQPVSDGDDFRFVYETGAQ